MTAYDARTVEAEQVALLRRTVDADIKADGEWASTMVRAGLLRDILDHYQALPVSPGTTTGEASEREISDSRHAALYPNTPPPSLEAVVASYWDAHEDAREMGYPSMTEALEALSEFREEQGPTPSDALGETVEKLWELLAKATPGEWAVSPEGGSIRASYDHTCADGSGVRVQRRIVFGHDGPASDRDADFGLIVAMKRTLPTLLTALEQRQDDWLPIESAPHACHVLAARFDRDAGEWIYGVVASPPTRPFTHWRPLPTPPLPMKED